MEYQQEPTHTYHKTEVSQTSFGAPAPPPEPPRKKSRGFKRFLATVLIAALVGGFFGGTAGYFAAKNQYGGTTSNAASAAAIADKRVVQLDGHGNLSVTDIATDVVPTVVGITTYGNARSFFGASGETATGSGSGVIIRTDGTIVTNYHVIQRATKLVVTLSNGAQHDAKVIGYDESSDIAVIKIDASGLTAIAVGDSDKVRVGDLAVAVGNPLGEEFSQTVTDGIISGIDRRLQMDNQQFNLIQTNCAINSGNSGGALVNGQGELIGINSVKVQATGVEGLGFAIPINSVMSIVKQIQETGQVERPYIGISGYSLTAELANQLNIKNHTSGIIVVNVVSGGPAEKAGIQANDVIYQADGQNIKDFTEFSRIMNNKKAGDTITVTIDRNGDSQELSITLGKQTRTGS